MLAWFKNNARRIGATYIITWRRIWSVARASEGNPGLWRVGSAHRAYPYFVRHYAT